MKIFFDTEFIEDGRTIVPVSIGMVREDDATLYYEFHVDPSAWNRADLWVHDNVRPHLGTLINNEVKYVPEVADEIVHFVGEKPEFWAYYADYDWVMLCQMYGRMVDLPKTWPMYCNDIKQLIGPADGPPVEPNANEHHALADALWNKRMYEALTRRDGSAVTP